MRRVRWCGGSRRGAPGDRDGSSGRRRARSWTREPEPVGKRRLAGRPALVLLYIAGPALLLGGAYLARLRSDLADRADYEVARRQCGASGGQGADTPAARFWCHRERQLHAALGDAAAGRPRTEAGGGGVAAGGPAPPARPPGPGGAPGGGGGR